MTQNVTPAAPYTHNQQQVVRAIGAGTVDIDENVDFVDVAVTGVTVNLPPGPLPGKIVRIAAPAGGPVTVSGNGHSVRGSATSVSAGTLRSYEFSGSGDWVAEATGSSNPGGATGSLIFQLSPTELGDATWFFDPDEDTVTMPADGGLLVINDAGTGTYIAVSREGTGAGESLSFNGNIAGDPARTAPIGEYLGGTDMFAGTSDGAAGFNASKGALNFASAIPNFAVGSVNAVATAFAGGHGTLAIRTEAEPTGELHSSVSGLLWIDDFSGTHQLVMQVPTGLSTPAYCVPVSPTFNDYAFPSDADQVLSARNSRSRMFRVAAGTLTGTHKVTATIQPTIFTQVFVVNNNAHDVQWAWATGAAATCPAGKTTMVSADTTNAIALASWTNT